MFGRYDENRFSAMKPRGISRSVEFGGRERGSEERERPLRKPHIHDYKLRLTLLSGVERSERRRPGRLTNEDV